RSWRRRPRGGSMTFRNEANQEERAAVLKNDFRANTMQGRAVAELQMEERGRFARQANVTASEAAPVAYPGAGWTENHIPDEPPLGFDVNAMEPVGEQFEVDRSRATIVAASHSEGRDDCAASSSSVAQAGAAPPQPKTTSSAPALSRKLMRRPL